MALAPHRSAQGVGPGHGQERGHGGPEAGPGRARAVDAAGGPEAGLEAGLEAGRGLEEAVEAASRADGRGAGLEARGETEASRRQGWGNITRYVTSIPSERADYDTRYLHRILYDEEDEQDEGTEGGGYGETALSDVD